MTRLLLAASASVILLAGPASAQVGNPAGMAPGTAETAPGVPAPHQLNTADRGFIEQATFGGRAEVEAGKRAEQKAKATAVKDFARRMVEDHSKANEQLMKISKEAGFTPPEGLDAEHKDVAAKLEKAEDTDFDRAYIDSQVQDHQKAAQLFEYELGSGQDPDLQRFAAATLPTILQHLEIAQDLKAELTGTSTRDQPALTNQPTIKRASEQK